MVLNIYLTFNGNCRQAFEFYQSAFGGEYLIYQTFDEGSPDMQVPDDWKDKVMHVSLPIGTSILMGSDHGPGQPPVTPANNFSISVNPDSREQCDELFAKVKVNGEVTMPLQEMFWGSYFGMCQDQFGINWMFDYELPK